MIYYVIYVEIIIIVGLYIQMYIYALKPSNI